MDRIYLFTALLTLVTAASRAEPIAVNTRQTNAQCNPSVATLSDGGFVVVWSSYYSSSGRSNEVMARRFDREGHPLDADEFQVNTTCSGNQTEPAVAACLDGGFVVVWEGPSDTGVDIFVRLFDPNGTPATDERRVNTRIAGQRALPRVAVAEDGSFVVVWEDSQADETGLTTVWGQLFDASGAKAGDELLIAADNWDCRYPDVAMDATGNFATTWLLSRTSKSVQGRLFDAAGLPRSEIFQINDADISSLTRPVVAMQTRGGFVVAWDGDPNLASLDDIHARCYEPNGLPLSAPFIVNSVRVGAQQWPRVAIDDANEVAFVWQSDWNDPKGPTSIWARRFDVFGQAMCEPFVMVDDPAWKQRYPDVALAADGTLVAAWETAESDRSDYDILAAIEPKAVWPDLTGDRYIDLNDLCVLGLSWDLPSNESQADLNADGRTDAADLQILCDYWLQ